MELYRAMEQLERFQRRRQGEKVPPPLNISGEKEMTFLRNKAKKHSSFNQPVARIGKTKPNGCVDE